MAEPWDLAVLGAGPGGYAAALRATQLGLRTVIIERERAGGLCGNWGCIPSKAILSSADAYARARGGEALGLRPGTLGFDYPRVIEHSREAAARMAHGVEGLLSRAGIPQIRGDARLDEQGTLLVDGQGEIAARSILLATGTVETRLGGVPLDPPAILGSRDFLAESTLPQSIAIIGGGPIGVEFAHALACFGVAVTIIEACPGLLPGLEETLGRELERGLRRRGVDVHTSTAIGSVVRQGDGVRIEGQQRGAPIELQAERCLVAVGRRVDAETLGLHAAGIELMGGRIRVDAQYRTNRPRVLAVGDLIDSPPLAHVATAEAIAAVEMLAGVRPEGRLDPRRMPVCVYVHPEIASIGLTRREARARGHELREGRVPWRALGRAVAAGDDAGFLLLLADTQHGEILGAHVYGTAASDLIGEIALAVEAEATVHELAATIHPHPSFAEAIGEAARACLGRAIHL